MAQLKKKHTSHDAFIGVVDNTDNKSFINFEALQKVMGVWGRYRER